MESGEPFKTRCDGSLVRCWSERMFVTEKLPYDMRRSNEDRHRDAPVTFILRIPVFTSLQPTRISECFLYLCHKYDSVLE